MATMEDTNNTNIFHQVSIKQTSLMVQIKLSFLFLYKFFLNFLFLLYLFSFFKID